MFATVTKLGGSMPAPREIDTSKYSGRVAQRLRTLRDERGWTVADVARELNRRLSTGNRVANSTVHGWDNGSRKIDPDYYPLLARLFGLTVAEFLPKK